MEHREGVYIGCSYFFLLFIFHFRLVHGEDLFIGNSSVEDLLLKSIARVSLKPRLAARPYLLFIFLFEIQFFYCLLSDVAVCYYYLCYLCISLDGNQFPYY